jgi:hypothetical protein
MTDFLTRLTARSFGAEMAIRPGVASLFETVRNGDTALRDGSAAEPGVATVAREVEGAPDGARKTLDGHPVSVVGPQPRADSIRRESSVPDDGTMQEEDTVAAAKMRPRGTPVSSQAENPILFHPSSSLRSDLEDGVWSITSMLAGKTREGEWEKESSVVAAKGYLQRPALSQPVNSDVFQSPSFSRSDLQNGAQERVPATARVVSPTGSESADSSDHGLVLSPKGVGELTAQMKNAASAIHGLGVRTRRRADIPSPAAEPEPSVHVTIGRIEVRATSESKHVERPRSASPVMSLEEYLHRRQRGDR